MSDLKPCPFCGAQPKCRIIKGESLWSHDTVDWTSVECTNDDCGIVAGPTCEGFEPSAIEAWNRRAQPTPITSESGNQAAQGASAITSAPLHQALTDPENQPNQYGVEFMLHGSKFAFRVGNQQFVLDYEPTEPGEFEFMRDMLIHAFSTFTPDVKTAQAGAQTDLMALIDRYWALAYAEGKEGRDHDTVDGAAADCRRAIESLVRSKLGAGVGWIACIDAMPPKNTEVLIKFRDTPLPSTGQYTGSPFDNDGWCYPKENDPDEVGPVTHWQPLPPPPGIVGKEGA